MNIESRIAGRRMDFACGALLSGLVLAGVACYSVRAHSEEPSFLSSHQPVTQARLQSNRGARDLKVSNLNDVRGSVHNNTASDIVSGSNSITNGAFSAVSGFPLVIQNSGSNVVIQSSTILNIGLQP